ncbi:MAG: methylenetetrahydrofolate reductase C-terminal domain-containing protein [Lentisphaeria bacterium]|nr:methylenetetrahydrofolate reductase C-terminal domain-containing protein [Lentisphaeria bacterium]
MPKHDDPIHDDNQLKICFEAQSPLKELLYNSDFFVQLECRAEMDGTLGAQTVTLIKTADETIPEGKLGFMATSMLPDGFSSHVVNFTGRLKEITSRPITMALSGQGRGIRDLKSDAAAAKSMGIVNFFAVTGNIAPDHKPDDKGCYPPYVKGYTDSLDTLAALKELPSELSLGAAVNPFKYTPEDQCLQYAKMFRKCANGADFIVTQAGWDLKKYQELQWFMQMRELVRPVLARIMFLSIEQAQNLGKINMPGLVIPLPVASKLQDLAGSKDQKQAVSSEAFIKYQCDLLALQTVGLKFLGYNGIEIAGLYDSDIFKQFWEAYEQASSAIPSYLEWLSKWHDFHENKSLAAAPTFHSGRSHYLFSNLLEPEPLNYDANSSQLASASLAQPPWSDKLKATLLRSDADGFAAKMAKKFIKRGDEKTYGIDNSSCPKRLTVCPCGNSRSDGYCEANHAPCIFKKVVELSAVFNEMNLLD